MAERRDGGEVNRGGKKDRKQTGGKEEGKRRGKQEVIRTRWQRGGKERGNHQEERKKDLREELGVRHSDSL